MLPQLSSIHTLGVLPGVTDNRTNNAEVTGYQRYIYRGGPLLESLDYINGPLQSLDCVSHNDTV